MRFFIRVHKWILVPKPLPNLYGAETQSLVARMLIKKAEDRPCIGELVSLPHLVRCLPAREQTSTIETESDTYAGSPDQVAAACSGRNNCSSPPLGTEEVQPPLDIEAPLETPEHRPPPSLVRSDRECVDLAEAEYLLSESPQRRRSVGAPLSSDGHSGYPDSPMMCLPQFDTPNQSACDTSAETATPQDGSRLTLNLAELELLLLPSPPPVPQQRSLLSPQQLRRSRCGGGPTAARSGRKSAVMSCGKARTASKQTIAPRTPTTCSKMLRSLEL